jgi:hypothetical protein
MEAGEVVSVLFFAGRSLVILKLTTSTVVHTEQQREMED